MNNKPIDTIAAISKTPARTPAGVMALMETLNMNDRAFAILMNVTPYTVRLWTTGAVKPCNISLRLMQIYEAYPDIVNIIAVRVNRA